LKIVNVELFHIRPRFNTRLLKHLPNSNDVDSRMVTKITTDNGIVGYGDYDLPVAAPPLSKFEYLIGRNPFDFLNTTTDISVGMALYDVMGKYLEVPAYKLMGQKVREGLTMCAWSRRVPPEGFAEEIQRAAAQGYMWFKMHTGEMYDIFEQTRAAEEVAPPGFRIHYDFNGAGRTAGTVMPIIAELQSKHPIVGVIEDALPASDHAGWRSLRGRSRIPLAMQVPRLGGIQEALQGCADIYMIGGWDGVGGMLSQGMAYGRANIQVITQLVGGTLGKALALHMAAVLPTATGHSINLDDQYDDDITTAQIPVVEGFSRVPEAPGLGVEVDDAAIRRLAANTRTPAPRCINVVVLPGGRTAYGVSSLRQLIGGEEASIRGHRSHLWKDDGSPEFEKIYERVQNSGAFIVD